MIKGPTEAILSNLQANIISSQNRKYNWCIFLQFIEAQSGRLRHGLSRLALDSELGIMSAKEERLEIIKAEAVKDTEQKHPKLLTTCLVISKFGYQKLGFSKDQMPGDRSFQIGMKSPLVKSRLGDKHVEWEQNYKGSLDAMMLISGDSVEQLEQRVSLLKAYLELQHIGLILFIEKGQRLPGNKEHFGFVDGLSQPSFWGKKLKIRRRLKKSALNLVLVKDAPANYAYGSFLAFRKFRQDVDLFQQEMQRIAAKVSIDEELVAAQIMGRFKDGTPLALFDSPNRQAADEIAQIEGFNEYNANDPSQSIYEQDPLGLKCPLHAHIRKANPRNKEDLFNIGEKYPSDPDVSIEKRIVRRSVPYEYIDKTSNQREVGLLFMSYQASLIFQFEVIHQDWFNKSTFPKRASGFDPLVGQSGYKKDNPLNWNKGWGASDQEQVALSIAKFVQTKGGEYFFAPSFPFFHLLANR